MMTIMRIGPPLTYKFLEDEIARPAVDLTAALHACGDALSERRRRPKMVDPVADYLSGVDHAGRWLGQRRDVSPMWRDGRKPDRAGIEEELDFALRVAADPSTYPDNEIGMTAGFASGVADTLLYATDLSAPPPAT